jgi:hypothetical protein
VRDLYAIHVTNERKHYIRCMEGTYYFADFAFLIITPEQKIKSDWLSYNMKKKEEEGKEDW